MAPIARRWLGALAGIVLLATPAQGDEGFAAALAAWLDDEDAVALPALAALAAEGRSEAQVLIALIDRMPETHSPWVAGLTRAERRALMRAPSGRSWMDEAAGPLAALWREAWDADADPAIAFDLVDLGEPRAARVALLAHAARQRHGFAELARDPRYPEPLRFLAWWEAREAPETEAALAALHPGDPQRAPFEGRAPRDALGAWLLEAEVAAPVGRYCAQVCPADPGACAVAAFEGIGGYRALVAMGSPAASLVPEEDWLGSLKGVRSLPRRLALLRDARPADACLASAVARVP